MRERYRPPAKEICRSAGYAVKKDDRLRQMANRTVLTIRPCSSSSGAEECPDKRFASRGRHSPPGPVIVGQLGIGRWATD